MRTLEASLLVVAFPCATACPLCLVLAFLSHDHLLAPWGFGIGVVANSLTTAVLLLEGQLAAAAISATLAVGCALGWWDIWKRRRRRGQLLAMLGNKARAIKAAIVRKLRESGRPRPVLRPAPGGAG